MTEAVPWVKWRFDRWRADEGLRMVGLAARGLWADLLAIMHGCKPYGHLAVNGRAPSPKQIASMVGMTSEREVVHLLHELGDAGVYSISDAGLIYCRRMVRDNAARERGKETGSMGGNPFLMGKETKEDNQNETARITSECEGGLTPPDNPEKREERREREEEKEGSLRSPRTRGQIDDPDFGRFWTAYPRKDDKGHARKAWKSALKLADADAIIAGVMAYSFQADPTKQPMPATWLNGERWRNEANTPPPVQIVAMDPKAEAERTSMLQRWHDRLVSHHGDLMDGVTLEDVARASKAGKFTEWLDAIESGDERVLDRLRDAKVAA